jgi:hypothetical protein
LASVCLAVYVAFWLQLDNAYWARTSAPIVCQPQLGASMRKAIAGAETRAYRESEMSSQAAGAPTQSNGLLTLSALAALGVVFGDIGTSPLYTLATVLDYTGPHPDPAAVLGALLLILWTLFLVTTVKYVNVAMRVDNDGEGGIIALMTLLGLKTHQRRIIIAVGSSARRSSTVTARSHPRSRCFPRSKVSSRSHRP